MYVNELITKFKDSTSFSIAKVVHEYYSDDEYEIIDTFHRNVPIKYLNKEIIELISKNNEIIIVIEE
jgi:hypothetical protein